MFLRMTRKKISRARRIGGRKHLITYMSTLQSILIAIGVIGLFVLGALTYRGCTKRDNTAARVDTVTVRIAPDTVVLPVERWKIRRERIVDTLRITEYLDAAHEPESGGIGYTDTVLTREAVVVHQGGETRIPFTEALGIECDRYTNTHRILFSGAPVLFADTNICNAIVPEPEHHGFWTDVLYVLAGIASASILFSFTR